MTARRVVMLSVGIVAIAATATAARTVGRRAPNDGRPAQAGGADSTRVAGFLSALGTSDPVICTMIGDQIGNFWTDEGREAVGRFADAQPGASLAQDSLQHQISNEGALRTLVARLDDPNACVRRAAAKLLEHSSAETSRIAALLSHQSPRVREAAAYALSDESRKASRADLERVLRAGHMPEAAMAAWSLGEQGDVAAAPALRAALGADDARTRWAAAHAFGELHTLEQAPPELVRAARSSDQTLTLYAVRSLAEIHDPATVEVLAANVDAPDARLRLAVVEALGETRSAKAIPALTKATRDVDARVRRAATEALGEVAKD